MDLKFPHHENEIAQSCAACDSPFVHVWMHNGFVNIDDEKMSKSLGNFFTVREVLKTLRDPEVLRFFLLEQPLSRTRSITPRRSSPRRTRRWLGCIGRSRTHGRRDSCGRASSDQNRARSQSSTRRWTMISIRPRRWR